MKKPTLTVLAQSLPASVPFVGPETQERLMGRPFVARLGANESAFGPSPKAIAAMQKAAGEVWMYGDPESYDLRQALAKNHNVPADCIIVGEGIDTLLGVLVRLYVGRGDAVVTSAGAYPTFNYHVAGFGGVLHKVAYEKPMLLLSTFGWGGMVSKQLVPKLEESSFQLVDAIEIKSLLDDEGRENLLAGVSKLVDAIH